MLVKVRVIHGSLMTSSRTYVVGDVLEMHDTDARDIDPRGECLEVLPPPAVPVVTAPLPLPPPPPAPVVEAPPPALKKRKKGAP